MVKKLTPAQLKTLFYLRTLTGPWGDRQVEISISEMAKELGLDRSTVSRALNFLKDQGLIEMELLKVAVRVSSAAIRGYGERDRAIADCDRHAQDCDRHAQDCDRHAHPSLYKYFQLFLHQQLAGEKDFAEFQGDGSTAQESAALINQLENLFKQSHQNRGQFSAVVGHGEIETGDVGRNAAVGHGGIETGDVDRDAAVGHGGIETGDVGRDAAVGHGGIETGDVDRDAAVGHGPIQTGKLHQGAKVGHGPIQTGKLHQGAKVGHGSIKTGNLVQQEIWEIAPGEPYPVFLNWRAAGMARQEGHWQENAYRFSYSEFYNNRTRTTKILWPEFLEAVKQVTLTSQQALAVGMQAVLPSWFIEKPVPTIESAEQVMSNLRAIISQGAQVAMPQKALTASCQQTMSYAEATNQMVSVAAAPTALTAPTGENASAYALFQPANLPAPSAPPEGFFQELAQKLAMRKQPQQQQFQGVATNSFEKYKAWMQDPVLRKEAISWAYKQDSVRIVFDEEGNPYDLEQA